MKAAVFKGAGQSMQGPTSRLIATNQHFAVDTAIDAASQQFVKFPGTSGAFPGHRVFLDQWLHIVLAAAVARG